MRNCPPTPRIHLVQRPIADDTGRKSTVRADFFAWLIRCSGFIGSLAEAIVIPGQIHTQHADEAYEIVRYNNNLFGLYDLILDGLVFRFL